MSRRHRPIPTKRRPTVTVVIPCYNYGRYLPAALVSVLEQPDVDVDVIVIDDASPDGSADVVRQAAAADHRVRAILHRANCGHIATYNEGLAQATGDYVVLLSADDVLAPGALSRATALLEAHPFVGMVYGHPASFAHEPPRVSQRVRSWTVWPGEDWIRQVSRTGRNCILSPEVVMRTSVLDAVGGFDHELPHAADLALWLRAAAISDVGRVNGPAQAFYRIHPSSMQRTTYAGHVIDLDGRLDAFRKVLRDPSGGIADAESLLERVERAIACAALDLACSAYAHGRAELEPISDYLDFATRVWPGVDRTRKWRKVAGAASTGSQHRDRRLALSAGRLSESINERVRWHRWRWTGV